MISNPPYVGGAEVYTDWCNHWSVMERGVETAGKFKICQSVNILSNYIRPNQDFADT